MYENLTFSISKQAVFCLESTQNKTLSFDYHCSCLWCTFKFGQLQIRQTLELNSHNETKWPETLNLKTCTFRKYPMSVLIENIEDVMMRFKRNPHAVVVDDV